jgi:hypothetical protein
LAASSEDRKIPVICASQGTRAVPMHLPPRGCWLRVELQVRRRQQRRPRTPQREPAPAASHRVPGAWSPTPPITSAAMPEGGWTSSRQWLGVESQTSAADEHADALGGCGRTLGSAGSRGRGGRR